MKFPCRVLLRCKKTAVVNGHVEIAECFDLQGRQDGDGALELWRADGKWRETGEPHPLDIVGVQDGADFKPFTG